MDLIFFAVQHPSWTYQCPPFFLLSFVSHLSFLTMKSVNLVAARDKIIRIFIMATLITEVQMYFSNSS